jgi:hypothetical protein
MYAAPATAAAPPEVRRRRSLAVLIGVTIVVMAFALTVFAWMYWLAPIQG